MYGGIVARQGIAPHCQRHFYLSRPFIQFHFRAIITDGAKQQLWCCCCCWWSLVHFGHWIESKEKNETIHKESVMSAVERAPMMMLVASSSQPVNSAFFLYFLFFEIATRHTEAFCWEGVKSIVYTHTGPAASKYTAATLCDTVNSNLRKFQLEWRRRRRTCCRLYDDRICNKQRSSSLFRALIFF